MLGYFDFLLLKPEARYSTIHVAAIGQLQRRLPSQSSFFISFIYSSNLQSKFKGIKFGATV